MYGLSPASVVRFKKSGDGGAASFVSSAWLSDICCVVVASSLRHLCLSVLVLILVACYLQFLTSRVRQSAFRNPFPTIPRTTHCVTLCVTTDCGIW